MYIHTHTPAERYEAASSVCPPAVASYDRCNFAHAFSNIMGHNSFSPFCWPECTLGLQHFFFLNQKSALPCKRQV